MITPKKARKASKIETLAAANAALIEDNMNQRAALANSRPKRWLVIFTEVLRIIIAALSGAGGASLL